MQARSRPTMGGGTRNKSVVSSLPGQGRLGGITDVGEGGKPLTGNQGNNMFLTVLYRNVLRGHE